MYWHHDGSSDGESRRSFVEKGVLATGGVAFGLPAGAAARETETPRGTPDGGGRALMFNDEFRPDAQFRVTSPVLDRTPDVDGIEAANPLSEYNTRVVEYLNTNEEVVLFPAADAAVERGRVYELRANFSRLGGESEGEGLLAVRFDAVSEGGVVVPDEDNQLDPGDDFDVVEGGGKALVRAGNFFPGALLRLTSGVVAWRPQRRVRGSDVFSQYNTRFAEYLNTDDEVTIYTAEAGEFERGDVYVVRDEFDVTDPTGFLVTADLARVDEDDLGDDLLD